MSPPPADNRESPRRAARREALERRQRERHQRQEEAPAPPPEEERAPVEREELSLKKIGAPLAQELVVYMGHRLALLKLEVARLAGEAGRDVAILVIGAGSLMLGYVLVVVGMALLLGALIGGAWGMGVGIFAVGALHLIGGGLFARHSYRHLSEHPWDLAQTRAEFERDVKWLKEIKETPLLTAPEGETAPEAPSSSGVTASRTRER